MALQSIVRGQYFPAWQVPGVLQSGVPSRAAAQGAAAADASLQRYHRYAPLADAALSGSCSTSLLAPLPIDQQSVRQRQRHCPASLANCTICYSATDPLSGYSKYPLNNDKRKAPDVTNDGSKAPDFKLQDDSGKALQLSKFKGRPVVVYFYPKDDTSGCTAQAKDFSCLAADFRAAGAEVIGISPDSPASHAKFKAKHELDLKLAADTEKAAAEAYCVWVEKSMYGKKYMGVERSTFLIDKAGRIAKSWRKVKVPGHAEEVLAAVKEL
jgi:thioredoxin-dependent peroxiredoxin